MSIPDEQIKEALKKVKYPGFSRDIVSFGIVKEIRQSDGEVIVQLALTANDPAIPQSIKNDAEKILRELPGVRKAKVLIDIHAPATAPGVGATHIPGVKHVIAVASGKGGVGKSTVAANLAVALEQTGARVGLCDCDIYGPSISLMFGSRERPMATEDNRIIPIEQYGLRLMSMGFLLDDYCARDFARANGDALYPAISAAGGMGRTRLSRPRSATRARAISNSRLCKRSHRRARSSLLRRRKSL